MIGKDTHSGFMTICKTVFLFLLISCAKKEHENEPELVSLISLVANPEMYSGRTVAVSGYFSYETENVALYLDAESYRAGIIKNAIWLKFRSDVDFTPYKYQYVNVIGEFSVLDEDSYIPFSGILTVSGDMYGAIRTLESLGFHSRTERLQEKKKP